MTEKKKGNTSSISPYNETHVNLGKKHPDSLGGEEKGERERVQLPAPFTKAGCTQRGGGPAARPFIRIKKRGKGKDRVSFSSPMKRKGHDGSYRRGVGKKNIR